MILFWKTKFINTIITLISMGNRIHEERAVVSKTNYIENMQKQSVLFQTNVTS